MNRSEILNSLCDEESSFAILKTGSNDYKFFYHPEGCLKYSSIEKFNGFIFSPFDINSVWPILYLQPSIYFEASQQQEIEEFISCLELKGNGFNAPFDHHISSRESHENLVNKAKASFDDTFNKVIISRIEKSDKSINPLDEFERLCQLYPGNCNYIFNSPESGLWIGSTPEKLLSINDGNGSTCALAGTKSINDAWSNKELKEQRMVKDYVQDILNDFTKEISKEDLTIKLGNIEHLKTNYEFTMKNNANIHRLISELHPTPAVGGVPKQQAIEFISFEEPQDRMYYSGYLGEVCFGKTIELYVNLRCMNVIENIPHYFVGGGITEGSEAEAEYVETERKLASIQ